MKLNNFCTKKVIILNILIFKVFIFNFSLLFPLFLIHFLFINSFFSIHFYGFIFRCLSFYMYLYI